MNLALCKQRKYEEKETLAKIRYEKKITANLKNCTKPFFSYLRSKRKVNTTVTSLVREDGSETKGAGEAASELSAFFSSVFERRAPTARMTLATINPLQAGDAHFGYPLSPGGWSDPSCL